MVAKDTRQMHYQDSESKQSKTKAQATIEEVQQVETHWQPCKEPALVPECGADGFFRNGW